MLNLHRALKKVGVVANDRGAEASRTLSPRWAPVPSHNHRATAGAMVHYRRSGTAGNRRGGLDRDSMKEHPKALPPQLARLIDGSRAVRLEKFDPADTAGLEKEAALEALQKLGDEFAELGNLLTYAGQHGLLVVLQGKDASGKDGAIRKILDFSNIQNARVTPFKAPTESERRHDFLWRVHAVAPERGHIALFNRSHYEDVLAARIHQLVPEQVWKSRYEHINAFERLLVDSDVIVLKFCLHVSLNEQIERLLAREDDPRTAWKLNPQDWRELSFTKELDSAYEDALSKCSSPGLPWYLVPSDKKWFRNLAIMQRLVLALRPYREQWLERLKEMGSDAMKEIRGLRAKAKAMRNTASKEASKKANKKALKKARKSARKVAS